MEDRHRASLSQPGADCRPKDGVLDLPELPVPTMTTRRRLLTAAAAAFVPALRAVAAAAPPTAMASAWLDDLDGFRRVLGERHVGPFERVSRERFDAELAALRSAVPALDDGRIAARFQRLVALVGDSHTRVALPEANRPALPLALTLYDEGYVVSAAAEPWTPLVGARLDAIGGVPIADAVTALGGLIAHTIEPELADGVRAAMLSRPLLADAGLVGDAASAIAIEFTLPGRWLERRGREPAALPLEMASGLRKNIVAMPLALPRGSLAAPFTDETAARVPDAALGVPLLLRDSEPRRNYFLATLAAGRALYLRYRRCVADPAYPIPRLVDDARARLASASIERVVIDLRQNGGGDSSLLAPFGELLARDRRYFRTGAVRALIDEGTYSSAMLNAFGARAELGAMLFGTPAGHSPNHQGEVRSATLPSGRTMIYSVRNFRLAPDDPRGRAALLEPDVALRWRYLDRLAGVDTVLAAALDGL
jgi:hypothetical protein